MTKKDVIEAIPIQGLQPDDILVMRVPRGLPRVIDVARATEEWLEQHGLGSVHVIIDEVGVPIEKLTAEQLDRVGLMRKPLHEVRGMTVEEAHLNHAPTARLIGEPDLPDYARPLYTGELLGYIVRFVASGSVLGIMPVQREGEPTHLCLGMVGKTEVFPTRAGAEIAIRATVDWRNKGPVPCAKEDEYEILALVRERQ